MASAGRPDLIQALGLYSVHLELPRAWSLLGIGYTGALVGYTLTVAALLMTPGPWRLSGLGLALLGLGGYQTASPVELSLTLGGILVLATGLARTPAGPRGSALSLDGWRALIDATAARLGTAAPGTHLESSVVEIVAGPEPGSDSTTVRVTRGERLVELAVRRDRGVVEALRVLVGARPEGAPDTTIEAHETWLSRPPAERPAAPRQKTGDAAFDRRWGVYGRPALGESHASPPLAAPYERDRLPVGGRRRRERRHAGARRRRERGAPRPRPAPCSPSWTSSTRWRRWSTARRRRRPPRRRCPRRRSPERHGGWAQWFAATCVARRCAARTARATAADVARGPAERRRVRRRPGRGRRRGDGERQAQHAPRRGRAGDGQVLAHGAHRPAPDPLHPHQLVDGAKRVPRAIRHDLQRLRRAHARED